ncbi:MAG: hypothetical protein COA79_03070 [Planctomycetota bacterium]|nr:MAG: hypothetical protein COA79_03070 [Planctomycetota bacterium]
MLNIPEAPNEMSGQNVLIRLIDSIKFRFQIATHGLEEKDFAFKPSDQGMTLENLLKHIYHLQKGILSAYSKMELSKTDPLPEQYVEATINILDQTRAQLLTMSDQDLLDASFHKYSSWHIINGPLADTLTHIGQVNMMRRMFGNPTPKASVLAGTFDPQKQ